MKSVHARVWECEKSKPVVYFFPTHFFKWTVNQKYVILYNYYQHDYYYYYNYYDDYYYLRWQKKNIN